MKLRRMVLALGVMAALASAAFVAYNAESPGGQMATAAQRFLELLDKDQKQKASFAFDSPERTNWYFTPQQDSAKKYTRKGLPLLEMTEEQKKAALGLLAAGTSAEGNKSATTIMSLESILHDLETPKAGKMVRDSGWYFFTIFGTPSATGSWGWRVEGHHLSLNFTLEGDRVVSSTPAFFGANPATVLDGPRKGLQALGSAEELARNLFKSLDADQQKIAHQDKQFPEIKEKVTSPQVGDPVGLPASKMTSDQKNMLKKLIEAYAGRMPAEVAEHELAEVKRSGLDNVHFAYAGGVKPREPYSYRVHGPTFVIEFLNVQADSADNKANHIHSAWRTLRGDFGLASK
jgi:hypothetical protein